MIQGQVKLLTTYFGQMPCIGCGGHYAGTDRWCNGGIPQLANTTAHVAAMEKDMASAIPDKEFAGYIVHDWEAWEATWGYASAEYRNASIALARSQNPGKSEAELEAIASDAYTNASVELLALTARTSRRLRPRAKVGFYGLPHKQYWPQPQLNKTQQGWNDLFMPLWNEVNALFPSIYEPYESGCHDAGCQPVARNTEYVDATIQEAVRISKLVESGARDTPGPPVLPYAW